MAFLQFLNGVNYLEPVQSHLDSEVIFKIGISDEVNHYAVESQLFEVRLVLGQLQGFIEPVASIIGRPRFVMLFHYR